MYSEFPGTTTEYKNLHQWVNTHFGKPHLCDECGTTDAKRYDWAAIEGRYTKDRKDWRRLCRSCHQKFDAHLFIGKRFSGKQHREDSKRRTSETLKAYWAAHPEQLREIHRKSVESRLRNKALRGQHV
jgi:hypothetical protein